MCECAPPCIACYGSAVSRFGEDEDEISSDPPPARRPNSRVSLSDVKDVVTDMQRQFVDDLERRERATKIREERERRHGQELEQIKSSISSIKTQIESLRGRDEADARQVEQFQDEYEATKAQITGALGQLQDGKKQLESRIEGVKWTITAIVGAVTFVAPFALKLIEMILNWRGR